MTIRAGTALRVARQYMDGLRLPYAIDYGKPLLISLGIPPDEPLEWKVPVILTDGITYEFPLYVDAKKPECRNVEFYKPPSKEQLVAAMCQSKQRFVVVTLEDPESAKKFAGGAYDRTGVVGVSVCNGHDVDAIRKILEKHPTE